MYGIAQTLTEPIVLRKAVSSGFICRFEAEFVSLEESNDQVDVRARGRVFNAEYTIRSKYVFDVDGARSKIAAALNLPFAHGEGREITVWYLLVEVDLSHLASLRNGGNMLWTFQEDHPNKDFVWVAHPQMDHPYHQWVVRFFGGDRHISCPRGRYIGSRLDSENPPVHRR